VAVAVALLALAGCGGGGSGGSDPVRFTTQPAVTAGPNEHVPLARIVTADTNVPARLEVTVAEQNGDTFTVVSPASTTTHAEPIIGLKPGRTYDLTVAANAGAESRAVADRPLHVTTDPLPANFPAIDVRIAGDAASKSGFTLFGTRKKDGSAAFIVIVDGSGDVVWFMEIATSSMVRRLQNGNLITILANRMLLLEVDLLGRTARTWYAARSTVPPPPGGIPVDVFTFHNDIVEVGSGSSFLVSSDIVRFVDDFPTDEHDAAVRTDVVPVLDEPIVEFAPDGTTLRTWNFLDLLKPTRIGFDSTLGLPDAADWAHTNAVILDARDDSIIASLRHQDAVVKASRSDGTLRWILGPHDNWEGFEQFLLTPVGEPFAWSYHQHAPQLTSRGTLLVFDNGNRRASPFTGQPIVPAANNHSRAVEYAIDEQAHTVRQVWEFNHPEQLYAPFVGSAYELPTTGNVLVTYGGLCTVGGVNSDDILHCRGTARLVEVRRDSQAVVFDLGVRDPDPNALGWLVYRGERIARLGPPNGG
jgi:hypothetical protein